MMKKFISKLIINGLIVIGFFTILLFYSYYNSYQKNRVPYIKNQLFEKIHHKNDTVGLVLGSSHAFYGIDSKLLDSNVFNFSSVSQSLMEDYIILKHIKKPINKVIIPISYFSNWHFLYKTHMAGERLRVLDYQKIYNINYPFSIANLNPKEVLIFVKGFALYISELSKNIFKPNENNIDYTGNIIGKCNSIKNDITDEKIAFERHNIGKDFNKIHPYLDSITVYCAKNNIELYLVAMPQTHKYRNLTSASGFNEYLTQITTKYKSNNCLILDFRDYFNVKEEPYMFNDADHLSFCGRNTFTKYLSEQIELNVVLFKY